MGEEQVAEFAETLEKGGNRMLAVLAFLRRQNGRNARSLASQMTANMVRKLLREGMKRSDIAAAMGISERRVYQIQKNMKQRQ